MTRGVQVSCERDPRGALEAAGEDARDGLWSLVVAGDIAHAKLKERLDAGQGLPQCFKDHAVYYVGPVKTPDGLGPQGGGQRGEWREGVSRRGRVAGSRIERAERGRRVVDAPRVLGPLSTW